jgi:hypothetical protein
MLRLCDNRRNQTLHEQQLGTLLSTSEYLGCALDGNWNNGCWIMELPRSESMILLLVITNVKIFSTVIYFVCLRISIRMITNISDFTKLLLFKV